MDNSTWRAYGRAPNAGCLVGRDGRVIEQEGWFDPQKIRAALKGRLKASSSKD